MVVEWAVSFLPGLRRCVPPSDISWKLNLPFSMGSIKSNFKSPGTVSGTKKNRYAPSLQGNLVYSVAKNVMLDENF